MTLRLPDALERTLQGVLEVKAALRARPCSGGCLHDSCTLHASDTGAPLAFLKRDREEHREAFETEAAGLVALDAAGSGLRVPRPLGVGVDAGQAWLLLEFLPLGKSGSQADFAALGEGLARLHRTVSVNGLHGWSRDNTLGSTPQRNPWTQDWAAFFRDHRLAPQFELAANRGRTFRDAPRLLERVTLLLAGHQPEPSLLHGDLWAGNAGFLPEGTPAIFDPATYHGDRETDLAFSRLFGGFPSAFYAAYAEAWPLPDGQERRARLYNLYHLLNHFHLFGSPYDHQAEREIAALLR